MANIDPRVGIWLWGGVQLLGMVSAGLARLSEGSSHQTRCQWFFLLSLFVMGLAIMAAIGLWPGYWLGLAITLALMILVAICDFRRAGHSIFTLSEF